MSIKSLEELSLEKLLFLNKEQTQKLIQDGKDLEKRLIDLRRRKFTEKYNISPEEAYEQYYKLVKSCSGCGGEGYTIWIPELRERYQANHYIVKPDKYNQCQPTERDREAFRFKHDKDMKIATKTHWEVWGN